MKLQTSEATEYKGEQENKMPFERNCNFFYHGHLFSIKAILMEHGPIWAQDTDFRVFLHMMGKDF